MAITHNKKTSSYFYLEQHAHGNGQYLGIHFASDENCPVPYVETISLGAYLFDLGRFRLPMEW